jgi:hypothetical protein
MYIRIYLVFIFPLAIKKLLYISIVDIKLMAGPLILCNTPCSDKSWLNEKNRSSSEGSKVRQNPKLGMKLSGKVQFS